MKKYNEVEAQTQNAATVTLQGLGTIEVNPRNIQAYANTVIDLMMNTSIVGVDEKKVICTHINALSKAYTNRDALQDALLDAKIKTNQAYLQQKDFDLDNDELLYAYRHLADVAKLMGNQQAQPRA